MNLPTYGDALLREVARRMAAGEGSNAIARAVGIKDSAAAKLCRKISKATGIPTSTERRKRVWADITARTAAGEQPREIAEAIGRKVQYVQWVLNRLMPLSTRQINVTAPEASEIKRRAALGESARQIARALGLSEATIRRHAQDELRAQAAAVASRPPCDCGKRNGHPGACSPASEKAIRSLILAGKQASEMSRSLGCSLAALRSRLSTVRAAMIEEGLLCSCGLPAGHEGPCEMRLRPEFREKTITAMSELLQRGCSAREAGRQLNLSPLTAIRTAREIFRSSEAGGKAKLEKQVLKLLRVGHGVRTVARMLELSRDITATIARKALASGERFADCPCGRQAGHAGPCAARRARQAKKTIQRGAWNDVTSTLPQPTLRRMRRMFSLGYSTSSIAKKAGVSSGTAKRITAHWRGRGGGPVHSCVCGKPIGHAGGCIKNTPGSLGKRWTRRIEQMLMEGLTVSDISRECSINADTVLRHAVIARSRIAQRGDACECGRLKGHAGTCSATWERGARRRGPKPVDTGLSERVRALLVNGEGADQIKLITGAPAATVFRIRGQLSADDKATRRAALAHRRASKDDPHALIISEVQAAVSRSIDPSIRDEVVAELCLAILEGRLEMAKLRPAARTFTSRAFTRWASMFGPRSLDGTVGSTDRNLADVIGDGTAGDIIDEIQIGGDRNG
ncbi:hypothetical protein NUH86_15915 [Sphingobium sp. JS3065]|uniref:hypothetical protein n=1 Tax=Sphingobium sp. JS3065 TaxID=2970925 RepID=UPI002263D2B8|nr:hypothetical protein [Sphingobium sp. JS3065]UZW54940.1 hypothetical protein NUH86_15915 [Sphingobium sp. JS3065]